MNHAKLINLLSDYGERRPDERGAVERILGLVTACPDCLDRGCRPGHLTGSAWVTTPERDRFLLVHHRKLGRWLQPGGHADGDADLARVALREAREESGLASVRLVGAEPIDVDVHEIPARRDATGAVVESAHEHHDLRFLCVADASEPLTVSAESHDVCWFDEAGLRRVTDEWSVLRLLEKARLAR